MPMPWTYRQATREWQAFLEDAKAAIGTPTDHSTFTAVEGVLRAFRNRLTPQQAIDFAQILPAVLRALFVADWRLDAQPLPAGTRVDWTTEAKSLRPHHNLAPDGCVAGTALALRQSVHRADLERVLRHLPAFATEFWSVPSVDTTSLGPRIV
ncbi:DUF2267 domain-containing protein [Cypionkella sinensis]